MPCQEIPPPDCISAPIIGGQVGHDRIPQAVRPKPKEQSMKGQESKKTAKKEPAKTMKEKKEAKKIKKEEKQRQ